MLRAYPHNEQADESVGFEDGPRVSLSETHVKHWRTCGQGRAIGTPLYYDEMFERARALLAKVKDNISPNAINTTTTKSVDMV